MKFSLLLLALLPSFAFAANPDYCLAVRGNGENVAAHWPAMARLVEENGMPEAVSGGSSASVSLFFLDSIAGNAGLNAEADPIKRRRMQALLLKSLPEFVAIMARQDGLVDAFGLLQELKNKDSRLLERVTEALKDPTSASGASLLKAFRRYAPLINPVLVKGLQDAPEFFRAETISALKVFGQFDARQDANLFVRPGVADFKYFAIILGAVADFYAGNDADSSAKLGSFLNACASESYRAAWPELSEGCRAQFSAAATGYLAAGKFPNRALFTRAGENIRAFPSTAVIKGDAVVRFRRLLTAYGKGNAKEDYAGFTADLKQNELGFAYWGKAAELKRIENGLREGSSGCDLKAKLFTSLGSANWFEVLATSPAEPGLASMQEIPQGSTAEQVLKSMQGGFGSRWSSLTYRSDMLSVGGWSDLHPTGLLRAAGCAEVVYLTRKDGDAIFSQQVFIRLANLAKTLPFWEKLEQHNNDGWKVDGDAAATAWNQLYNLGNPESSFNRSLKLADAIYCTDWNRYKVFKGEMNAMVKDAYASPVFLRPGASPRWQVNPEGSGSFPGCAPFHR